MINLKYIRENELKKQPITNAYNAIYVWDSIQPVIESKLVML